MLVQEHWLSVSQLCKLAERNDKFLYHAVCGCDDADMFSGRPYGGLCCDALN